MAIQKETLKGGAVLRELVKKSYAEKNAESYVAAIRCLRDSDVWMPVSFVVDDKDYQKFQDIKAGDEVRTQRAMTFVPNIMENEDGMRFIPVFSSVEQMQGKFDGNHSKLEQPFLRVVYAAEKKEVDAIILDPFTDSLILRKKYFETVKNLPTNLEEKEDE